MSQKRVTVHAAKTDLSRLIREVEVGTEVVIARRNVAVVRLVRVTEVPRKRKFGAMKGKARVTAAFFEPLPFEDLVAWDS